MCLEISTIHHPDLEPLTAEEDIEVVKYLKRTEEPYEFSRLNYATFEIMTMIEAPSLRTPYMSYPVEFDENDECVMEHYMSKCGLWVVEGIHAYTEIMWWCQSQKDLLLTCTPYKAYIPKGTKYYFGTNGDIVAEKMIIKNIKY